MKFIKNNKYVIGFWLFLLQSAMRDILTIKALRRLKQP